MHNRETALIFDAKPTGNARAFEYTDEPLIRMRNTFIEPGNDKLDDIIKKARIKFDWRIDYIQLGTQFMQARELKDYPKLLEVLEEKEWQNYFIEEAKSFKDKIIS